MDFLSYLSRCGMLRRFVWTAAILSPITFTPIARAVSEPSPISGQKRSFGYSWQQELQLGAQSDKEVTAQMGLYDNPEVQGYVSAVGQRVLAASTFNSPNLPAMYRDTKFTFRVLDSPVVNAFALPGGYIYVTRGLLTHLENEAQLAVVLGHEIGHVAARHASQQARRSEWTQLGVIAGAILGQKILGDKVPDVGQGVLALGGQTAQMFLLRYSREAETEADTLGVTYAAKANYAAGDSARFFEALKQEAAVEGKTLPAWQSTHPDPGDRARHVVELAASTNPGAKNLGAEEYLRHVDGMIIGEDPREGFAQNGTFYDPELHFQMPAVNGWKLDNQRTAVTFTDPNGRGTLALKLAPGSRARDAAAQFTQQSKIEVTASGDTQVNGLPTSVVVGNATTDQGDVAVWDAFIELEGKVFSLLGTAPRQAFEQVRPTFEQTAGGFSPLRDPRVAAVQPARVKLVHVDREGPFASFVPTSLPPDLNAQEVAIMNQLAMDAKVPRGQILKIPDVTTAPVQATMPAATNSYPENSPTATAYPTQGTTYPAPANYPAQTYPAQNYPSTTQTQTYPTNQGYPQSYPNSQPYPSQNYPAQNYPPQGYPNSTYPSSSGYPTQPANTGTSYPNAGSPSYPQSYPPSSPNSGYPAQNYPPQPNSYPGQNQNYPQFPQPGGSTNVQSSSAAQPAPSQSSRQPVWPR